MARPNLITRTIQKTKVTYLVADLKEQKIVEVTTVLTGIHKNDEKLLATLTTAEHKAIGIKEKELMEEYVGVTVEDFTAIAKPVDKKTGKFIQ